MKYLFLPLTFLSFTMISCNQENELKLQEGTVTNQPNSTSNSNSTLIQNLPSNDIPIQAVTNNIPVAPTNNNVKLNPEHGKPGHRCEIAVGAPLNSEPNNTQKSIPTTKGQISPIQFQQNSTPSTPKANTISNPNAKINPPHGQPGHICESGAGETIPE